MSKPLDLDALFRKIDEHERLYIKRLSDVVAIKSVSAWLDHRDCITEMTTWVADRLKLLGATIELKDLGIQEGTTVPLPKVLFATLGNDPTLKTLMVYGHLDVQPANKDDGWDQDDPFKTEERNGNIYGRGSTDDKGPVLAWLNCLDAMKECDMKVPVNLKFLFEGMEESGSEGLDDLIKSEKEKPKNFFQNVDYVCISDNYWLGKETPCLTYGLRGICYCFVEVEGGTKDLHSGLYGGTVYEAMSDLIHIMDSLVNVDGSIKVPGVGDKVDDVTEDELKKYEGIDFDLEEYKNDAGVDHLIEHGDNNADTNRKTETLMHRWRYPSLSLHGIEGAFSDTGSKTVIPRKVIGKFSIRLVPSQGPLEVQRIVQKYIEDLFEKRGSKNKLSVTWAHGGKPWVSDINHINYKAGEQAMKTVYPGRNVDYTREGGSIPVTLTIQEATETNVMLLPIGQSDDGAHSQNEKMSINNYIGGIKVMGAYMYQLGKMSPSAKK